MTDYYIFVLYLIYTVFILKINEAKRFIDLIVELACTSLSKLKINEFGLFENKYNKHLLRKLTLLYWPIQ